VNGFAVREQYYTQIATIHIFHLCPSPDSSISLKKFTYRLVDGLFDPCVLDAATIRAKTRCLKVVCGLECHGLMSRGKA